jgi:NAD(P)-dependent dehydrogenase (short-subunit alcohol dehydrogenase family)
LLKPALKLMSFYRLGIDEIKGDKVITSYTRWIEAVIVQGAENQEVYVTFSPQFAHIWLESKKRLLDLALSEFNNKVIVRIPGGEWAEAEDLAGAAIFLASSASKLINDVTIPVDGGYSAS